MSEKRCPSCLMAGFETLVKACSFCGIAGCDLCIHDGDMMYNAPTCCADARELHEAWWALPSEERFRYQRGACAEDATAAEARELLARLTVRAALPPGDGSGVERDGGPSGPRRQHANGDPESA